MLRQPPFAERVGETVGYVNEFVDRKIESLKVTVAEKSAGAVSGVVTGVILAVLGLILFVFALTTLASWIAGEPNWTLGFGIVSLILLALMLIIYLLRNKLIADPAARKTIGMFYSEKLPETERHALNRNAKIRIEKT